MAEDGAAADDKVVGDGDGVGVGDGLGDSVTVGLDGLGRRRGQGRGFRTYR